MKKFFKRLLVLLIGATIGTVLAWVFIELIFFLIEVTNGSYWLTMLIIDGGLVLSSCISYSVWDWFKSKKMKNKTVENELK